MPANANLLPPGSYLLSGVDGNGVPTPAQMVTIKRSGAGTVTVYEKDRTAPDLTGPNAKVRFPVTDGYLKAGASLRVEATDPHGIGGTELWINGKRQSSLRWDPAAKDGTATMTVRVYDKLNNLTQLSRKVVVDNRKPTLRITSAPANNSRLRNKVTIAATATDKNVVTRVEMLIDGKVVAVDKKAAYRLSLDPKKYGKKFTLQLRAYDRAGNVVYSAKRTYRR
jgi:hypothetical protein